MSQRLSNLVSNDALTNNLTTTSRTSGLVLDARQGQVLDTKIAGLEATKATITILTDPFAQFTATQGQYYVFADILYKRTGATVAATPSNDVYEGNSGWQYVVGAKFFDGFITYPSDPHTFNNDSRWVKYQPGVTGQRAIKGQIWYLDGKAYRNVDVNSTNGIGIIIGDASQFTDTTKWEPIIFAGTTAAPTWFSSTVINTVSGNMTLLPNLKYFIGTGGTSSYQLSIDTSGGSGERRLYNLTYADVATGYTSVDFLGGVTVGGKSRLILYPGDYITFSRDGSSKTACTIIEAGNTFNVRGTLLPSTSVRAAVSASSASWNNGELQGTQPAGSVPGQKFCDNTYRYEFMCGAADVNGDTYVWVRLLKAIN
jgi:hypothetical protein